MNIAFIGLGNMGSPLAGLLIDAGHTLIVYNRTPARAEPLMSLGAQRAATPGEAAAQADVLISMLADEDALQAVLDGPDGAFAQLPRGAVHVGMSTVSVAYAQTLTQAHAQAGQRYISAPVFGRPDAAAAKKLWIVTAGDAAAVESVRPVLENMGQGVIVVGEEAYQANTVKLGGNYMLAAMLESLGEAFALVRNAGMDAEQFLDIINRVFRSPVYENYGKIIADERFHPPGFKLRLGLKDMRLVLAAADGAQTPMPVASLLHDRLLAAMARGMGELDWSALGRLAAEDAGLPSRD